MERYHLFKYFTFESMSKIKDILGYKEWIGETDDDVVVIIYKAGVLNVGVGDSEIKARCSIEVVGQSQAPDVNINLAKINDQLKLEWILPKGYLDE